jgi:hypothetical protein
MGFDQQLDMAADNHHVQQYLSQKRVSTTEAKAAVKRAVNKIGILRGVLGNM